MKELSNVNCVEVSARRVKMCSRSALSASHSFKSKKYANVENVPLNLVA